MALFDDPKKELERLADQLRREEEEAQLDELVEEYLEEEEDYEEYDEYEEYEQEEPVYRNFANDYGRAMTEALWEEEQDSDRVIYRDDYRETRKKKKKKKKMSFGEAIFLILLDVALVAFLYWGWQNWIG